MNLFLIVLTILLLAGGGYGFKSGNHYLGGGLSLVIIILIILLVTGTSERSAIGTSKTRASLAVIRSKTGSASVSRSCSFRGITLCLSRCGPVRNPEPTQ